MRACKGYISKIQTYTGATDAHAWIILLHANMTNAIDSPAWLPLSDLSIPYKQNCISPGRGNVFASA